MVLGTFMLYVRKQFQLKADFSYNIYVYRVGVLWQVIAIN